ncbi:glutaredoxin-C9-like [Salvia hispanica]|uniref:glutaredoxin-C9-like n=1 Tax=Salvia hispanica TaxID=49212 RepID=UPI0020097B55|nr:glutaredoxin-C9-like [Salvia hispanica]
MQKALHYRDEHELMNLRELVAEKAVVVFAHKGCCMCHVVKLLLNGHGVNPAILDVDELNEGDVTEIVGGAPQFPAVFLGGVLFGGVEQVMGAHISGELVPRLRQARALWL